MDAVLDEEEGGRMDWRVQRFIVGRVIVETLYEGSEGGRTMSLDICFSFAVSEFKWSELF